MFEDTFVVNGNKYNKGLLKHRESLVKKIIEKSFHQVIEEVAYKWFNRLIAIRFMEVNEYLPTGVRVLLFAKFQISFYQNAEDAVFIALGVE